MNKLPYTLLQEDASPLNQQRSGLLSTITAVGGAQIRNYSDIIGLAQTGNIEIGTSYNCSVNIAANTWNGRDVNDVCWLEKWTDVGGVKEIWYAPVGAAGAAPVWQKVDSIDLVNAARTFTGTVGMANATAAGHGVTLGQADGRYAALANAYSQAAADTRYGSSFLGISATVAANALTTTLNLCKLDFRSATLTTGVPNNRSVASALSLVVPTGATLGTIAATSARLALLAIDNAGTVELAVTNLAGGLNLDETTLISTTAISAAATAANVIYSTTARTSVPFRVIGFIDITEATAGTWATAPSLIQGCGGQALAAMSSLGYGQTWQSFTVGTGNQRVFSTTYYNTTAKPIMITIWQSAYLNASLSYTINGFTVLWSGAGTVTGITDSISFIVPPNGSYSANSATGWLELR